jgi:hypothetical protein
MGRGVNAATSHAVVPARRSRESRRGLLDCEPRCGTSVIPVVVLLVTAFVSVVTPPPRPGFSFLAYDTYSYFLVHAMYAVRAVHEGAGGLLWNPFQNCGQPFFANPLTVVPAEHRRVRESAAETERAGHSERRAGAVPVRSPRRVRRRAGLDVRRATRHATPRFADPWPEKGPSMRCRIVHPSVLTGRHVSPRGTRRARRRGVLDAERAGT